MVARRGLAKPRGSIMATSRYDGGCTPSGAPGPPCLQRAFHWVACRRRAVGACASVADATGAPMAVEQWRGEGRAARCSIQGTI